MWTLGNLVPGFGRLPQATPKFYWKNPKLFKLLRKNEPSFFKGHSAPEISTIPDVFSFRLPPQVRLEPLCGTSRNLGWLPQATPKFYWKNPKLFKLLRKSEPSFFKGHSAPEIPQSLMFSLLGCPRKFGWNLYVEPRETFGWLPQTTSKIYWKNPKLRRRNTLSERFNVTFAVVRGAPPRLVASANWLRPFGHWAGQHRVHTRQLQLQTDVFFAVRWKQKCF